MVNPEQFTFKNMLVIYIKAFVELYNWTNHRQIYKIYRIIKLWKIRVLTAENPGNLSGHQIIEISLVFYNAYVITKDQEKFVFYINNYMDWNQFNQLYDFNWIDKSIKKANTVTSKLGLALIRATNHRLEVTSKKRQEK